MTGHLIDLSIPRRARPVSGLTQTAKVQFALRVALYALREAYERLPVVDRDEEAHRNSTMRMVREARDLMERLS